ncbi:MAG TPA: hypothetical protein VJ943_06490 [Desulfotignum sp.]|nr:hypothetical protein [Desulfotignum sp.]
MTGPRFPGAGYRSYFHQGNRSPVNGFVILVCLLAPPDLTVLSQHTSRGSLPSSLGYTM